MRKAILRGSVLALLLVGVASEGQWVGWQGSVRSQGTVLDVAVPDRATVVRKQGKPSLTGQLTAFNQTSLTLSAEGYSEKVSLMEVKSIAFEGDIWIEGDPLPQRITTERSPWVASIRESDKTLQDLPTKAFNLGNPPRKAAIALDTMSSQGLGRFLKDTQNKSYGVKKILLDSSEKMTIHIGEIE